MKTRSLWPWCFCPEPDHDVHKVPYTTFSVGLDEPTWSIGGGIYERPIEDLPSAAWALHDEIVQRALPMTQILDLLCAAHEYIAFAAEVEPDEDCPKAGPRLAERLAAMLDELAKYDDRHDERKAKIEKLSELLQRSRDLP